MAKFVVDPRVRTLLGGTYRRRRSLGDFYSGAGAAPIAPDLGTPSIIAAPDLGTPQFGPIPAEPSSGPSLPASFFAPSTPVIPARVAQPAPVAPNLTRSFGPIPDVQIVFPSQGSIATTRPVASSSWLDQQMIAGVPNSYLLGGAAAVALFAMLGSRKRRR
jgi:hypothetical protein